MCAIFGSRDLNQFARLAMINEYRGGYSYSLAGMNDNGEIKIIDKNFGLFPYNALDSNFPKFDMYIGHVQAPTSDDRTADAIHPAVHKNTLLWHNGIIKHHQIQLWKQEYPGYQHVDWDTRWLSIKLEQEGFNTLNESDGSFACLYYADNRLMLFRNANCPMFYDDNSNFSSTEFSDVTRNIKAKELPVGVVYELGGYWKPTDVTFNTKEEFYWSP